METESKELTVIQKQVKIYDIQETVLNEFKDAEALKCKDTKSRKTVGRFRADAKSLRSKIEAARLDKNREQTKINNDAAEAIKTRLSSSIDAFDVEIKKYDKKATERAAAKKKVEKDRLAAITVAVEMLEELCADCIEYNIESGVISERLKALEEYEITEEVFQEQKAQADLKKLAGVASAKQALISRISWEDQQAENERIRLENEAKEKELEEKQAKLERERLEREDADRKAREAEEEIKRQEYEAATAEREAEEERQREAKKKIDSDRKALEKEEAELAHKAIIMERESVWEIAHLYDFNRDHGLAIADHEQFLSDQDAEIDQLMQESKEKWEASEKAKKEAAEREKILGPDRMMITTIATDLENLINDYKIPAMNTKEANSLVVDIVASLKTRIWGFDERGKALK